MGVILDYARVLLLMFTLLTPSNETNFSYEYVGIWFNPSHLTSGDEADPSHYNMRQLEGWITMVSSEFRHFIMPSPVVGSLASGLLHNDNAKIPKAIAMFNKALQPDQLPIRLTMLFEIETSGRRSFENFEFVKGLADEANSIFPNTVQALLLWDLDLGEDVDTDYSNIVFLKNVQTKIRASKYQYKLGAIEEMEVCGDSISSVGSSLIFALPFLQIAVFADVPFLNPFRDGINETLEAFTRVLDNCKAKISALGSSMEIGFLTYWPTHPDDEFAQTSDTPFFWRGMNDWAVSTSTTVLLQEAFENPVQDPEDIIRGWWRLTENKGQGDTDSNGENYVFETREEAHEKVFPNTFAHE